MCVLSELHVNYFLEFLAQTTFDLLNKRFRRSFPRFEIFLDEFDFDVIGIVPWKFSSNGSVQSQSMSLVCLVHRKKDRKAYRLAICKISSRCKMSAVMLFVSSWSSSKAAGNS